MKLYIHHNTCLTTCIKHIDTEYNTAYISTHGHTTGVYNDYYIKTQNINGIIYETIKHLSMRRKKPSGLGLNTFQQGHTNIRIELEIGN